jgi:hypothetical protein
MEGDTPSTQDELDLLRADFERAKVQLELIVMVARRAVQSGSAFGSELRLANRILAIADGKL